MEAVAFALEGNICSLISVSEVREKIMHCIAACLIIYGITLAPKEGLAWHILNHVHAHIIEAWAALICM